MKVFSFFTKTGKIEIPINDSKVGEAQRIVKNPLMELSDKLREMNDLSNRLTKLQLENAIKENIVKVEFTDTDGSKKTLLKEADPFKTPKEKDPMKVPGLSGEFGGAISASDKTGNVEKEDVLSERNLEHAVLAESDKTGDVSKGGPGSGRKPEGGSKIGLKEKISDNEFNRAHYKDLIGSEHEVGTGPSYANREVIPGTKYNFHSDAGHGWLAVPKDHLKEVGLEDKISPYSYMKGNTAYLEEDDDASKFHNAMKQHTGNSNLKFDDYTKSLTQSDNSSPIRSYESYKAPEHKPLGFGAHDSGDANSAQSEVSNKYNTVFGTGKVEKLGDGKSSLDALRDIQGKLQKGGPGSGRKPEGGSKDDFGASTVGHEGDQRPINERATNAAQLAPRYSKDKPEADGKHAWTAPSQPKAEPEETKPEKPEGADDKKVATEYAKTNVPMKHQDNAKAYINSDQFKEDVDRHTANRQKEISNLGYSQGPHPAVRAVNEHLHPMMTKTDYDKMEQRFLQNLHKQAKKSIDSARNIAGSIVKGGPGSGRKTEGGAVTEGKKLFSTQRNIGQAKYVVNYHDGVKTHPDGSKFYDIHISHNKPDHENFIQNLKSNGYSEE